MDEFEGWYAKRVEGMPNDATQLGAKALLMECWATATLIRQSKDASIVRNIGECGKTAGEQIAQEIEKR